MYVKQFSNIIRGIYAKYHYIQIMLIPILIKLMGLTISFENDKIENWPFLDISESLELQMSRTLESQVL